MATEEPFFGLATFKVAPRPPSQKRNPHYEKATNRPFKDFYQIVYFSRPVEIPQLRTQTLSRGAAGLILATQPT
jgi:hypothetical protein